MPYLLLKHAHMTFALLSVVLLSGRFLYDAYKQTARHKWVGVFAHGIDFLLIGAGVTMWLNSGFWSLHAGGWLFAKIVGLIFYAVFGVLAFRAKVLPQRWLFFSLAMLSFVYVLGVAFSKSPVSWFVSISW